MTVSASGIAGLARLLADTARADMAVSLLGGQALTAGELSRLGGLSPSAASPHLARLVEGNLLTVERQGRHRYYRLAGPAVAAALEAMLAATPSRPVTGLRTVARHARLRRARTCYDHLAGEIAVELFDRLVDHGLLRSGEGSLLEVTEAGRDGFAAMGVSFDSLAAGRRPLARSCLDWTERRHHLAGALGAALLQHLLASGTVAKTGDGRALRVAEEGADHLGRLFRPPPTRPAAVQSSP